ncbi:hypothetical protein HJC23_006347 [Cyclotella cryptica]|uniref:C-CAP/cofactor C-like domain-containing protein n=1 Tax=Cyclotella cryptica TaxID=29204 RepID=A0ABD3Q4S2_9STRA
MAAHRTHNDDDLLESVRIRLCKHLLMSSQLKPLGGVLDNVINRLAAIEAQLGITPSSVTAPSNCTEAAAAVIEQELHPRLVAYDEHVARALVPFTESCKALGADMDTIGENIFEVWGGMRGLVELGTVYKRPIGDAATAIQPHLKPCQDAITKVQSARLDRKFDWHIKAVKEMLSCVSWVVISPPPSPANFVKDTVGASDFWANKIRKEYKTNEAEGPVHTQFCDAMKALVNDLSSYLKEHHLSGLAWNPHGKDFSEAKVGEGLSAKPAKSTDAAAHKPTGGSSAAGIFDELKKKQTGDGSSAATGLKKVTRDQQTWRKEYKKPDGEVSQRQSTSSAALASKVPVKSGGKTSGPPKCEYQERGFKWNIENQTKENCEGGVCKVEVMDSKQQVYIFNCQGVTIQIIGKLKSVILDSCTKCGVVFDTAISACEIVNCKSVQVQATNLCPSFSIDKTDGCVVHLTNEAVGQSSFVTSKSSEMNVSWPDDQGEIREAPIPEQFHHKIVNGSVTSQVSDLYH